MHVVNEYIAGLSVRTRDEIQGYTGIVALRKKEAANGLF